MPNIQEDAAIWIADVNVEALVDECRRRALGKRSRRAFKNIGDELLERAVWARRRDVAGLVGS